MASDITRVSKIPPLPARGRDSHKGTYGRVLVISGSVGMSGAPAIVGLAALRGGAGLATIATPASVQPQVTPICPCATTLPLPETLDGRINPVQTQSLLEKRQLLSADSAPDALAIGPGIGTGPATHADRFWAMINAFRERTQARLVLDADALNLARLGGKPAPAVWNMQPHPRTVITPHPGELARMHKVSVKEIQSDREGFARRTADTMNEGNPDHDAVVVLKGAGTVVTDGSRIYVNQTGNPGMATGGSGDVLTGFIAALLAQGMSTFDAAVAGVHLHGRAGDLAAERMGQVSLIATDLIDSLPEAIESQGKKNRARTSKSRT